MSTVDIKALSSADQYALNEHLSTRSYINGFKPSAYDVVVYNTLPRDLDCSLNHVNRWAHHIASFCPSVRAQWADPDAEAKAAAAAAAAAKADAGSDDELDFGSDSSDDDDDDDDLIKRKMAEAAAKKAEKKKKKKIDKSNIIMDIKPSDIEVDLEALQESVASIEVEGLVWGGFEIQSIAFGLKKLVQIMVVVDDLVSVDDIKDEIEEMEDVQSVDIVAFNKAN